MPCAMYMMRRTRNGLRGDCRVKCWHVKPNEQKLYRKPDCSCLYPHGLMLHTLYDFMNAFKTCCHAIRLLYTHVYFRYNLLCLV
jgi:hypothetical protein